MKDSIAAAGNTPKIESALNAMRDHVVCCDPISRVGSVREWVGVRLVQPHHTLCARFHILAYGFDKLMNPSHKWISVENGVVDDRDSRDRLRIFHVPDIQYARPGGTFNKIQKQVCV